MCTIDRTCDLCFLVSGAVGTFCKEALLHRSYEAFLPFRLCSTCAVGFSPRRNSFGCFATGTSSSSLSHPSGGQGSRRGSRDAPGFVSRGASFPPAGSKSSERGGSASGLLSVARERALASLAPSGAGEGGVARSQRSFLCPLRSSVVSHHSSPHARQRRELWEPSEDRYRVLSSRGSRSSDHGARVDKRARSRSGGFR